MITWILAVYIAAFLGFFAERIAVLNGKPCLWMSLKYVLSVVAELFCCPYTSFNDFQSFNGNQEFNLCLPWVPANQDNRIDSIDSTLIHNLL
jgi:hypothetical protein